MSGLHPSMSETCLLLNHLLHRNMLHHHLVCNNSVKTLVTGDTTADDCCCIASLTFLASFMVSMCSSFAMASPNDAQITPSLGNMLHLLLDHRLLALDHLANLQFFSLLSIAKLNSEKKHCCRRVMENLKGHHKCYQRTTVGFWTSMISTWFCTMVSTMVLMTLHRGLRHKQR